MLHLEAALLEKFEITGGNPLKGDVEVSGSKNATLAIMAGALLSSEPVILKNVPRISDTTLMVSMLRHLGCEADWVTPRSLFIDASRILHMEVPADEATKMRASFHVAGPLLARCGYARLPLPGGCNIAKGGRPVNFHEKGLKLLGTRVDDDGNFISFEAPQLVGSTIFLEFPSAGATEHLMTAAVLAKGTTIIENAAQEPEVVDLAAFLTAIGAHIVGAGTRRVIIEGVPRLKGGEHTIITDRMEVGTFALAAAATRGSVHIVNADRQALAPVTAKLREAGVIVENMPTGGIRVQCTDRPLPIHLRTHPHPGFPTDMQQPMGALLATAKGTSVITEGVYDQRFNYTKHLRKMGADVTIGERTAVIRGVDRLQAATVQAVDLRAGAAMIIAALSADGTSIIEDIEHIDRGYSSIEKKLNQLGAKIIRLQVPEPVAA